MKILINIFRMSPDKGSIPGLLENSRATKARPLHINSSYICNLCLQIKNLKAIKDFHPQCLVYEFMIELYQ